MTKQKRNRTKPLLTVEFDREDDGRWIAEVPELPGVMAYGNTKKEALRRVFAVALRTLADKAEHGRLSLQISYLFGHESRYHGLTRASPKASTRQVPVVSIKTLHRRNSTFSTGLPRPLSQTVRTRASTRRAPVVSVVTG